MSMVDITYFSDLLCIWAYASQARVDAIKDKLADAVRLEHRFVSVFGDTATKIPSTWKDKGGYEGFNSHLRQVAERFPHIEVHPDIWLKTRPSRPLRIHCLHSRRQAIRIHPPTPCRTRTPLGRTRSPRYNLRDSRRGPHPARTCGVGSPCRNTNIRFLNICARI